MRWHALLKNKAPNNAVSFAPVDVYGVPRVDQMTTYFRSVIKVGGSLFDLPGLAGCLRGVMRGYADAILFPGGGRTTDVIRDLDRYHFLGEEKSHWLALRALTLNAYFLQTLLPELPVVTSWPAGRTAAILDPFPLVLADDGDAGHLPHCWDVTSDSLAARAAQLLGAQELVLLKSVEPTVPGADFVDPFFSTIVERSPALQVRVINLRDRAATNIKGPPADRLNA